MKITQEFFAAGVGKSRASNQHEVLVRLENGTIQTGTVAAEPGYPVGDIVKINGGVIVCNA